MFLLSPSPKVRRRRVNRRSWSCGRSGARENKICPRDRPHGVANSVETRRRLHDLERSSGEMKTRLVPSFARGAMNRALCAFCAEPRLLRDFSSREESRPVTFPFMGQSGRPSRFFLSIYGWLSSPHLARALTRGFPPFMGSSVSLAHRGLRLPSIHSARVGRALSACFLAQAGLTLTLPLSYAFAHLAVSAIALTPFPFGSCLHFLPALLSSRLLVSG